MLTVMICLFVGIALGALNCTLMHDTDHDQVIECPRCSMEDESRRLSFELSEQRRAAEREMREAVARVRRPSSCESNSTIKDK